jgi:hypothetical protein
MLRGLAVGRGLPDGDARGPNDIVVPAVIRLTLMAVPSFRSAAGAAGVRPLEPRQPSETSNLAERRDGTARRDKSDCEHRLGGVIVRTGWIKGGRRP